MKELKKKNKLYLRVSAAAILIAAFIAAAFCFSTHNQSVKKEDKRIYGLTIDDAWYDDLKEEEVIEGLKHLDCRPVVRIVMSRELVADYYADFFEKVNKYADIMACPVDSSEMNSYADCESYKKRFEDAYNKLSAYVSIWETGNEINGVDWIRQEPELIIEKVQCATDYIKDKGGTAALTLYCTDSPEKDMTDWAQKYISEELSSSLDYCLISYYEDDNYGYEVDWQNTFHDIGKIFPDALLGIGECGNTAKDATQASKIAMAEKYYTMEKPHDRFIGGYFWWNWVEDCIPYEGNAVYDEIKSFGKAQTTK